MPSYVLCNYFPSLSAIFKYCYDDFAMQTLKISYGKNLAVYSLMASDLGSSPTKIIDSP